MLIIRQCLSLKGGFLAGLEILALFCTKSYRAGTRQIKKNRILVLMNKLCNE